MNLLLVSVVMIAMHNVDGDEILINVEQITTLHHTKEGGAAAGGSSTSNQLISRGNKCTIGLANGKFISVVEDCGLVRQAIREAR